MAFIIKALGYGTLIVSGTADLYTVPAAKSALVIGAIVNNLRFVNTGASSATVNLFFKASGGSEVRILDKDKSVAAGIALVVTPELTMAPADEIHVTTSAAMDYVVSGVERY